MGSLHCSFFVKFGMKLVTCCPLSLLRKCSARLRRWAKRGAEDATHLQGNHGETNSFIPTFTLILLTFASVNPQRCLLPGRWLARDPAPDQLICKTPPGRIIRTSAPCWNFPWGCRRSTC